MVTKYLFGLIILFSLTVNAVPYIEGYDSIFLNSWYQANIFNFTPVNAESKCSIAIFENNTDRLIPVYIQRADIIESGMQYEDVKTCTILKNSDSGTCFVWVDPEYINYVQTSTINYVVGVTCEGMNTTYKPVSVQNRKPIRTRLVNEIIWYRSNVELFILIVLISTFLYLVFRLK